MYETVRYMWKQLILQLVTALKCSMLQRNDKCAKQLPAKLLFDSGGRNISLHAFTSTLLKIAGHDDTENNSLCSTVNQEQLLSCPPFSKVT